MQRQKLNKMPICGSEVAQKKWTVAGLAGEREKKGTYFGSWFGWEVCNARNCHVPFLDWR